jgi:hypothetical protein
LNRAISGKPKAATLDEVIPEVTGMKFGSEEEMNRTAEMLRRRYLR